MLVNRKIGYIIEKLVKHRCFTDNIEDISAKMKKNFEKSKKDILVPLIVSILL